MLSEAYNSWNQKINVISRQDVGHLYERHVLHSLAIAKIIGFLPGAKVLDAGTGGGFPGIPLAIMFPETDFCLVDSIGKKIKVVNNIAGYLGLKNVEARQERVENLSEKFDFIVSRAVTRLDVFLSWTKSQCRKKNMHAMPNGILYLKGGDLSAELEMLNQSCQVFLVSDFFEEDFFKEKKIVYLPL